MIRKLTRRRPSPAMVVACLSLSVALSGVGYAAVALPRNSVGTPQLRNNAVISAKVRDASLRASDFAPRQLPAGPRGEAGPQGPKGDAGAQGPPGVIGTLEDIEGKPCTMDSRAGTTMLVKWYHFGVDLVCAAPDGFEPNDMRASAAVMSGANWATIYPAGDTDWYRIYGDVRLLSLTSHTGAVVMDVFMDGTQVADDVPSYTSSSTALHSWEVNVVAPGARVYQLWADD